MRYFEKVLKATMDLTGPNKWECIGQSVYRRRDTYVWKEGRKWFRTDLPPFTFRACLASMQVSPLGLFSESRGPYKTMAEARRGR